MLLSGSGFVLHWSLAAGIFLKTGFCKRSSRCLLRLGYPQTHPFGEMSYCRCSPSRPSSPGSAGFARYGSRVKICASLSCP
jgi:hypothetical protein